MNRLLRFATFAALAALAGCAAGPQPLPLADMTPTQPVAVALPPATPGAIYRAGGDIALFQDQKARNPGDLITILLVERTNATTSAKTKTSKNTKTDTAVSSLFGGAVTLGGRALLDNSLSGANSFEGSGDSTQGNRLDGSVTVTVAQRLANGNLVVRGQKRLRLNQGDEYVQVQGIVRGADIAPDNTVPSNRVADAQIVYGGRGPIAKSNAMGWLTRFFQSSVSPY